VELAKRLGIRQQKAWRMLTLLKKNSALLTQFFSKQTTPPDECESPNLEKKEIFIPAPVETSADKTTNIESTPSLAQTTKIFEQKQVEITEHPDSHG